MTLPYHNPLASQADLAGFVVEGPAASSFHKGRLRLENALDSSLGQSSHFVLWCPIEFPDYIRISWQFRPLHEPGLAILFFSSNGRDKLDLFDSRLPNRTGQYEQYHSGGIDALHLSYFRRKWETERRFHTCNLRKSRGFHLVSQGADPLPNAEDATGFYSLSVEKKGALVTFQIDGLPIFEWTDDGTHGPFLGGGYIGFRQMAPLIAEYSDLRVEALL